MRFTAMASVITLGTLAIWLFAGSGYRVGPIDRKIVSEIRKTCAKRRPCTYYLDQNIADFKWDRAYVFSTQAQRVEIEQVLNTSIPTSQEFSSGIAFMNKGRLVHFEQEDIDFEKPTPDSLNFDIPAGKAYKSYTPGTLFSVGVEQFNGGVYYSLNEWPCKPVLSDKQGKICLLPE